MSKLEIVKALLAKRVDRGCTQGEEAAAVVKAVELMTKYDIPHYQVASIWPAGWDFKGRRVDPRASEPLRPTNDAARRATSRDEARMGDAIRREAQEQMRRNHARNQERVRENMRATEAEAKRRADEKFAAEYERKKYEAKSGPARKKGSIGDYAKQLLMRDIAGQGPYSYAWILEAIQLRFPNAKTTVASLRWYESELRKNGRQVPRGRGPAI